MTNIVYSKNKNGSVSRDKKGRKKYEIKEGVDSLNAPLTLHKLLYGYALSEVARLINITLPKHSNSVT